jgi:tetratricopeptide (TPR) repeat protein
MKAIAESVKLRRAVRDKDPHSATARRELALGLYKLADAHCGAGRPDGASAPAEEATELFVALAQDDPASARARRDLALAYGKRGQVLAADRHPTTGLIDLQRSQRRCDELTKLDATNIQALEDEAAAWERLAVFYSTHAPARAQTAAQAALERWEAITKGVDAKTKAGQRRIALALLRCGDIYTEIGDFPKATEWYDKAAREAKSDSTDLLLAPVAKLVADQQAYLKAVKAGVSNVRDVAAFPPHVQRAALQTIARLALRSEDMTTAYVAALKLKGVAETGADKFAVARALAGCAAARPGTEKVKREYAEEAVAQLKDAIASKFRNAGALADPEWDAVGKRAKEKFEAVRAELAELNAEKK